jgi:hypothetical protein
LREEVWSVNRRLSEEENELLTKQITKEEVKTRIFEMKGNTAPGPDGFGVVFYKACWEVIANDFMDLTEDFNNEKLDIGRLNYGVITLIPKIKDAVNIKQFRPICLLNVSFKIFTKIIMERLTRVMDKLVDKCQTAFIKGRYILDGVVILHETLHEIRRNKSKGIILKIDFEKAYDSVKWGFVEEVLIRKGFGRKLRTWIMSTIKDGKVCININGENGPYFKSGRGLRQGDPLSPILFNLVGDALAFLLEQAKAKGYIKGLVPHLVQGGLTHLQYADDTILFMEVDDESIINLKFLLYCFEWMSGLRINYHKSEVFGLGVDEQEQSRIASMLNCQKGHLPITYLGIPIADSHLGVAAFGGLVGKIRKRLQPWKGNTTSSGGDLF